MTPDDIRDIHGPLVQAPHPSVWAVVIAFVLAAVLLGAAVALLRRRRKLTPQQRALAALAQARARIGTAESGDLSALVSMTVRRYVEEAFQIHAPKRTTEELLGDLLRAASRVAPYRAELGAFLELCDLAKYARWSLSTEQMTRLIDQADRFIRSTASEEAPAHQLVEKPS